MPARGASIAEIKSRALGMMLALAQELAPDQGRVDGHRYWACNPTRADRSPNSFCIDVKGATAGRWIDWAAGATAAAGEGGDVIDLVAYVRTGGVNFKSKEARGDAIKWLARRVGLEAGAQVPKQVWVDRKAKAERDMKLAALQAQRLLDERADKARRWWLRNGKPCAGTPTERYLVATRGIPMAALKKWPGAIRHLPEYVDRHGEVISPSMFCAMAAPARGADGAYTGGAEIRAVHRTFLTDDGRKDPMCADAPRKMWGDPNGAAIRLSKGGSRLTPEEAGAKGERKILMIAEAAEKGLPACLVWPDRRVWAAGTVGNMLALAKIHGWPACASAVVLIRDNDPAVMPDGRAHPAHAAFERAVQAWVDVSLGRPVSVLEPIGAKDFDELWRQSGAADGQGANEQGVAA